MAAAPRAVAGELRTDHSTREITAFTAYTLDEGQWQFGLGTFEYGALEWLDVGVQPLLWLIAAPNGHVKIEPLKFEHFSLAGGFGATLMNTKRLTDSIAASNVWFLPFELAATWGISDRLSLSANFIATVVQVAGDEAFEEGSESNTIGISDAARFGDGDLDQVAVSNNLQGIASLYWQLSGSTAAWLRVRVLMYQDAQAAFTINLNTDEGDRIQVRGGGATEAAVAGDFAVSGGYIVSWKRANLMLGGGYGNFNVPFVNIMVPGKVPFIELDVYFRF